MKPDKTDKNQTPMEIRIDRLGARGDGIADIADNPVFVPFVLPGETVSVRLGKQRGDGRVATLQEIVEESADRRVPDCRHFGDCGGCAAQHLAVPAYLAWKQGVIDAALVRRGIRADILPVTSVPPASRRRIRLAFRKAGGRMIVGFRTRSSDLIVDIADCPVALPEVVALIPQLRDFLNGRVDRGEIGITQTIEGADVVIAARGEPDLDIRLDAPEFCTASGIARLSWIAGGGKNDGVPEPVITLTAPSVRFGDVRVRIPPDSFLQPTAAGEAALSTFVLDAVGGAGGGASTIADLYAGCGAFSLPMAVAGKTVHAVEGLAAQTAALQAVSAALNLTAETRDLVRQPLRAAELARFDAVVLDPPRAGAAEQIGNLAGSGVPLIVYVSCNPASFARDARTLIDGGYTLGPVQPVDQFLWSHHVELSAIFRRN